MVETMLGTAAGMLIFGGIWYWYLIVRRGQEPSQARIQSIWAAVFWAVFYHIFQAVLGG